MKENKHHQEEIEKLIESPFFPPKYNKVSSMDEIPQLIEDMKNHTGVWEWDFKFLLNPSLLIKGWFITDMGVQDESGNYVMPFFFICHLNPSNGDLMGILDSRGKTILDSEYSSIQYSGWEDYFIIEKSGKFGMFSTSKGIICPPGYDEVTSFSEGVFGVVKEDSIGYMDAVGNLIVPIDYVYYKDNLPVGFDNGLLYLYSFTDNYKYLDYKCIDHYNNIIKTGFIDDPVEEYNDFLLDHASDETYDKLDAYEGDPGNLWNTD
jgi:hypothetical protein